jgi:tetratricopeptide (TPR) repeat protein
MANPNAKAGADETAGEPQTSTIDLVRGELVVNSRCVDARRDCHQPPCACSIEHLHLAFGIWHLAFLLFLSLAALPAHAQSPDAGQAAALFKQAVAAQRVEAWEDALALYQGFLALQPLNVEALSNLGVVYARLGRYEDAAATYRKALEVAPGRSAIRMNLALAQYKSGRHREAIREFDEVIASNPGVPNPVLLKADSLMQLGQFSEAAAVLRPLDAVMRDEQVFNYLYGMALLQSEETDAGLLQLDRILKNGDTAEARLMMGIAKRANADFAGAREDFGAAVEKTPDLPLAHSLYGQTLLATGDREAARDAFLQELAVNPNDFESNLYLGVILKEDRDYAAARRYFDRALLVRPGDPGARYQLATLFIGTGENQAALGLLEPLVAQVPSFVEARVSLATVYYRLKRKADGDRERDEAERLRHEAQAKQPGAAGSAGREP